MLYFFVSVSSDAPSPIGISYHSAVGGNGGGGGSSGGSAFVVPTIQQPALRHAFIPNSALPIRNSSGTASSASALKTTLTDLYGGQVRYKSPANPMGSCYEDMFRSSRFDQIISSPPLPREVMEAYAWNPDDRSLNIFVKDDDRLTFHRHPVAQSTDSIRAKRGTHASVGVATKAASLHAVGYTSLIGSTNESYGWDLSKLHFFFSSKFMTWLSLLIPRGTHASVGVATKAASLHAVGYTSLIGSTNESYGWDLIRNKCFHDSRNTSGWTYPSGIARDENYLAPDRFYCILDMDEGYMAFATDTEYYGVAFTGLKGKELYPVVSAVWGHCEITIKYLGGLDPQPLSLMELCRRSIRISLGKGRLNRVRELRLPNGLKKYLLYKY
ncbi:unnamed protein product [Gongylonema pulchrum]|uniref:B30.2/SPRY domain-containing protein n=1 Tax=Gongylonema pulchrum TaxID=637853 RepID=A0A3P7LQR3_9BILA|nr:unnamed protein product [Gongylonema pulchrum]